MTKPITLGVALAQTTHPLPEEPLSALRGAARAGAEAGAGMVILPELFWGGYGDAAATRRAALDRGGAAALFGAVAAEHGVALLVGYPEAAAGSLFNAAQLVDATGHVLIDYRKMHLWGDYETALFGPGAPSPVVELCPGLRVGVLVCFDLDFPQPAQDLAARGADLILVPSATTTPYDVVPRTLVPARAYENAVFIAFCNHGGDAQGARLLGQSTIAAPDGSVLAVTCDESPGMVIATIDTGAFAAYRQAHRYAPLLRQDLFPTTPARRAK